jgi:hypothetical protein
MHYAIDADDQFAIGFRRAAPSLGLNPNILGAKLDMTAERTRNEARGTSIGSPLPDHLYFRGHLPSKGEYSFALTTDRHTGLHRGQPEVRMVAWRYIERILNDPANSHLLEKSHVLSDMTSEEFMQKLDDASREPGVPDHVRDILIEAARRIDSQRDPVPDIMRRPR